MRSGIYRGSALAPLIQRTLSVSFTRGLRPTDVWTMGVKLIYAEQSK